MKIEDRLRRLADESRWPNETLTPRPASRITQERHGSLIVRLSLGLGLVALLAAAVIGGTIYASSQRSIGTLVGEDGPAPVHGVPGGSGHPGSSPLPAPVPGAATSFDYCPDVQSAPTGPPSTVYAVGAGASSTPSGSGNTSSLIVPSHPVAPNSAPSAAPPGTVPGSPAQAAFPGADGKVVPFAPVSGFACTYSASVTAGLGTLLTAGALPGEGSASPAAVATVLNEATAPQPGAGPANGCPLYSPDTIVFYFRNADGAQLAVTVSGGCPIAYNGTQYFEVPTLEPLQQIAAQVAEPVLSAAATKCPDDEPTLVAPVSLGPRSSSQLVPIAATSIIACSYSGGVLAHDFIGATQRGAAAIEHLAQALNTPTTDEVAPVGCPGLPGDPALYLLFSTASQSVTVRIQLMGCEDTSNGLIGRQLVVGGQQTRDAVTALLGSGALAADTNAQGTLSGTVVREGGPAPGIRVPESATVDVYMATDGQTAVSGKPVAHTTSNSAGAFSIQLPPGHYLLVAQTRNGSTLTSAPQAATVTAGATAHVELDFLVP